MRQEFESVLLLDAGNSVFSGNRRDLNWASEGRLTIDAMNAMKYDAMVIGAKELEAGVDVLRARMAEANFAFVSANVLMGGQLLAKPYAVIERAGTRIGILGLTSASADGQGGVRVVDPVAAARKYMPELRGQADVVIFLSSLEPREEQALLAAVSGADLVVGGGSMVPTREVVTIEGVPVVRAGGLGEYVGVTVVVLDKDHRVVECKHESRVLDASVPDDPEMAALKARYQTEYGERLTLQAD